MSKQNTAVVEPETETLEPEEWAWACVEEWADWVNDDEKRGYVYFVESDMWIKIGVARDVKDRIRQLQTGCPYTIELKGIIPSPRPGLIEAVIHAMFITCEKRGEWYSLSYEQIEEAVKNLKEWADDLAKDLREILH